MTLPKTIIIGPLTYTIEEVPDFYHKGVAIFGFFSPSEQIIRIERDMPIQRKRITLWEEIIHAVLSHAEKAAVVPEDVVSILSFGIMGVLQTNPILHKEQ